MRDRSRVWLFDEVEHAGEDHLDPIWVEGYDRKANVDPSADIALLRSRGLGRQSLLVDFGAGTGAFALAAAPICRRVIAVDPSPPMLDVLRSRALDGAHSNVEAVQAGFLTYQHEGAAADFVYSRNALHHLPDFWKGIALQRIAGMTRQGGVLLLRDLVYSFDPYAAETVIEDWLRNAPSAGGLGYSAEDLTTHIRTEFSTYSWILEELLDRVGFSIQTVERTNEVFAAYLCVKLPGNV